MNKRLTSLLIILGFIVLGVALFLLVGRSGTLPVSVAPFDTFAQCLAEKNVTMYGAAWCSHCQNEKKAFGDSFQYVPYVECPNNPKVCLDAGVEGYPTWILGNGEKLVGEQGLSGLADVTGCELPIVE
ncbi:MAG: hypothetical protein A3I31_01075 [Candidatus Colwellbacteria bacterium RIFCSPLOWO2_02_FULL_44_20b]|uniref:Thioredoxin domain-containing protein n=1 Tax=Candidatus Colwellbacteria bacterium RIFCSPLOWO2_02_FULL_44_20b TaxID=1797691 RepID=A0A1G1Z7N0_9BACT|nr:MAG: hypothetical protein A3I31_01075 [Candidatus Colwellbacteria bacterium RIFCSPLOWO2_02_FULL_44_20b]